VYDINLIRKKVVPERHRHMVFSVVSFSVLAYALTILAVVLFSAANFRMIDVYAREIDRLQSELSAMYPGTPTRDELAVIIRRVEPDLKEIGKFIDDRTEVTNVWGGIALAVPDSVWLTAVEVKAPTRSGVVGKGKARRHCGGVVVEGVAISGDGSSGLIRRFARRLEETEELKGIVDGAKYVETGKQEINGVDVIGFEITCPFQ